MVVVCMLTCFFFLYLVMFVFFFFFNDTATTEIYTLSLHDALPIWLRPDPGPGRELPEQPPAHHRSEEHTSELQSLAYLVCRLLLEKKKKKQLINLKNKKKQKKQKKKKKKQKK